MEKREIAEMFMDIYRAVSMFQMKMSDIGVDTGASDLQEVMVPDCIARLYGLTCDVDRKAVWSANVYLDFEEADSVKDFLDCVEKYAEEKYGISAERGK